MDNMIMMANQLQKVIDAKEEYLKQAEEYKKIAKESGVTDECINYILIQTAWEIID